jgi:hypothetical protein
VVEPGKTLKQRAVHEFKEFLIIAFYLWIVLSLFLVYKSVLLNDEHISSLATGFAIINAFVLGKIILIAQALHVGDWANRKPLIYPTLIKAALFSILLAVCKLLEAGIVSLYRHEPFQQAISEFAGGTAKGIVTVTLLMFVVLIPFCGFAELKRVTGEGKLGEIFFGWNRPAVQTESNSKT